MGFFKWNSSGNPNSINVAEDVGVKTWGTAAVAWNSYTGPCIVLFRNHFFYNLEKNISLTEIL